MSKFYFFCFGCNMVAQQLCTRIPSALRIGAGRLKDYQLDFGTKSDMWLGARPTIVPKPNEAVFGAVWEINTSYLDDLDKQIGVDTGIYQAITVPVVLLNNNKSLFCRTYRLTGRPINDFAKLESLPEDRQPSKSELKAIVKGAYEARLPQDYISHLKKVKHNSEVVETLEKKLALKDIDLRS